MSESLISIAKDVARHDDEISDIQHQLKELGKSHAEIGFILKTFMEQIPQLEKKIDMLGDKIQMLVPGKQAWDLEQKVEQHEKTIKRLISFCCFSAIMFVVLVLLNPDASEFLLGVLQNKVP